MNNAWTPSDPLAFARAYNELVNDTSLAVMFETTPDRVRKYIGRMRVEANWPTREEVKAGKLVSLPGEGKHTRAINYLKRAKTAAEIEAEFGDLSILETSYMGYELFKGQNMWGQPVWSLLPQREKPIALGKREFGFSQRTGLLLVNLPQHMFSAIEGLDPEVRLVPLFDVHYGHHAHRADKFADYIEYIRTTPNVLTWGGGDLMENALDDGRGMTYEQAVPPGKQIDGLIEALAPIAHKIMFLQPGNHEWRSYNKAGLDPTQIVARALDVPYFDGPVIVELYGDDHKWRIYSQHGSTNSQTKGGKMNAASGPRRFTNGVDFFVSGHVHDPIVNSETVLDVDPLALEVVQRPQFTVVAPSFLGYQNTYAQRAGYAPPGLGGVSLSLYSDGSYEARLHNRH